MIKISTRDTTHGKEYIFRHNNKLYVFKTKQAAEIKLKEIQNGSLF